MTKKKTKAEVVKVKTSEPKSRPYQPSGPERENTLRVTCAPADDEHLALAACVAGPFATSAWSLSRIDNDTLGKGLRLQDFMGALEKGAAKVNKNDLSEVEAMLYSQGVTLNMLTNQFLQRAVRNLHGGGEFRVAMECYTRLALKAQDQARRTFETLGTIKSPSAIFAKQANINNGGQQQVNNGASPRARENQSEPSKILEHSHEQRLDTGAPDQAGSSNPTLETVAALHRAENG